MNIDKSAKQTIADLLPSIAINVKNKQADTQTLNFKKEFGAAANPTKRTGQSQSATRRERLVKSEDYAANASYYTIAYGATAQQPQVVATKPTEAEADQAIIQSLPEGGVKQLYAILSALKQLDGNDELKQAFLNLIESANDEIIKLLNEQQSIGQQLMGDLLEQFSQFTNGQGISEQDTQSLIAEAKQIIANIALTADPQLAQNASLQLQQSDIALLLTQANATVQLTNAPAAAQQNPALERLFALLNANALLTQAARNINEESGAATLIIEETAIPTQNELPITSIVTATDESEFAQTATTDDEFDIFAQQPQRLNDLQNNFRATFAERLTAPVANELAQNIENINNLVEQQLIQSITQTINSGARELTMQLHPAFLGKMMITVSMTEHGTMTAKINAQNPYVNELVAAQAVDLANTLRANGVNMQSIDVGLEAWQQYQSQSQSNANGQNNPQAQNTNGSDSDFGLTEVNLDDILLNGIVGAVTV